MDLESRKYSWIDSIRIPFLCSPLSTFARIVIMLIARISPTLQIYATAMFIDRALSMLTVHTPVNTLFLPILLLGCLVVYNRLSSIFANLCKQKIGNGLRAHYNVAITIKRASLLYADVENSQVQDLVKRVSDQSDETMMKGFESLLDLLGIGIQATGFLVILLAQIWWAAIAVLAIAIPIVFLSLKSGVEQYDAHRQIARVKRRHEYISDVLTNQDAVLERSLFGFADKLSAQWSDFYAKERKLERKAVIKSMVRMKAVSLAMSLITFLVALVLVFPVSSGTLSVGLFIALVQASSSVIAIVSWDLSDRITEFSKQNEYLRDVQKFANLPETDGATDLPAAMVPELKQIEFQNVTFRYPGTERDILRNLNLKMIGGQRYALVGVNGAGKTTLTKLLTGLYTEFEGDILINGKSIRLFNLPELKALSVVLFQDFARYSITLRDNIAVGDMVRYHDVGHEEAIRKAAEESGLGEVIRDLPNGIDTPLGKLDDCGQDLSGGQWQRVAMARTVLSSAPLRILDEPTAALDPISESRVYEEFKQLSKGWTTLLISHRLGSTKLVDKILVLDEGRITQQGTHAELMGQDGLYREMYEKQRSWYQ